MKEGEKMALSGSFSVSQRNDKEKATCVWSATQDIANNKTTITAYLEFFHKYQINIGNRTHKIVINGVEKEVTTTTIACAGADTHRSTSVTVEVPHNADGTKNVTMGFTFSVKATLSGTYYESMSTSTTVNLDTIPRASQPTLSASSTEMTKAVTINTNRASSSFTHTLTYAFGSVTGTIAEGVGASYEWTIPLELANQIPNAVSGTGKIYCKTYNGSTLIGTKEVVFGATVPASVVPTRKSFSAVDTTGYMATYGGLIQGKSKLKVDVEAEGACGSTIKSYKILVGNTTYHGNSITADILGTSNILVSASFTDSRGRTGSVGLGVPITVIPYANPKISALNVYRCNSSGTADEAGEYITGNTNAIFTTFINAGTLTVEYKKQTDTEWIPINSGSGASVGLIIPVTAADPNCLYDVRATATDDFTSSTYQVVIPTVYTLMDFKADGMGVAFGKVATDEGFDVDMVTRFRQDVRSEGDVIANLGESNQLSLNSLKALMESTVGYTKKNRLKCIPNGYVEGGYTMYGCKFLINDDGSVSVNGKPTALPSYLNYTWKQPLPKGKYILTGCPSGGAVTTYYQQAGLYVGDTAVKTILEFGKGVMVEVVEDNATIIVQQVVNSTSITMNHTFYPMIRDADILDDTYEPYVDDVDTRLNEELICSGTVGGGAVACDFSQYKKITCYYYHGGYVFECTIHTEMIADYETRRFVSGYHKGYVQFNIHKSSIQIGGTRFDGVDNPNLNDPFYVFGHR